jgi:hypothetical protein
MVFKVSDNQVAQGHTVKPHFNRPVIVIVALVAALISGFFIVSRSAADNKTNLQHVIQADAARYSALAAYYVAKDEASQQQAIEAEAARYNGLAEFFTVGK